MFRAECNYNYRGVYRVRVRVWDIALGLRLVLLP